MKRILIATAFTATLIAGLASPATALNKTGAGGSIRRCVHWVNTTNHLGWPIEYCARWR